MELNSIDRDFLATKRKKLLTDEDFNLNFSKLENHFNNKKVLIIGGSGSIGSSFVSEISEFSLKSIHIIDPNENGLTNLVRNLRSKDNKASSLNLITSPLDFGSKITEQFIIDNGPYDFIYNFAAIKHVRSEKDLYSTMQMFDTNVVKHSNLLEKILKEKSSKGYFSVSTDKAANPVSLMGASKKIMELVLQCKHLESESDLITSTTRFANVAFSNGSLLQSFPIRFEKQEPLPAPIDIDRYFVSHKEAAQICMLSTASLSDGDILVPKISESFKLYPIIEVAKNFIHSKNLIPVVVDTKEEAYKIISKKNNEYPIYATIPDTSGEKEFEEFVGSGEELKESEFENFDIVKHSEFDIGKLKEFLLEFNLMLSGDKKLNKKDLVERIKQIVKSFNHIDTGLSLDNRM